jgi:hypothetical protein
MILKENGVWTYPDGRQVCQLKTAAGLREYKKRLEDMRVRQEFKCAMCIGYLHMLRPARFDHEDGRGMNGSHRCDKILHEDGRWKNAALCDGCNSRKGSKRYMWENGAYIPVDSSVYKTPDCVEPWSAREGEI